MDVCTSAERAKRAANVGRRRLKSVAPAQPAVAAIATIFRTG